MVRPFGSFEFGLILVEMKGFGVVHVFRTNRYLFTPKPHFCILALVINMDRHTTSSRTLFVHFVYRICGCENHNCCILVILRTCR